MRHAIWHTVRNLLLEFGAAEVLDTGLLRPALMALAVKVGKTRLIDNMVLNR